MSLPPCGFEALRSSTAVCHQNYRVWYGKGKPGFLEPQLEPALNPNFSPNGARIGPRGSGFLNLLCCIFLLRLPEYFAHHGCWFSSCFCFPFTLWWLCHAAPAPLGLPLPPLGLLLCPDHEQVAPWFEKRLARLQLAFRQSVEEPSERYKYEDLKAWSKIIGPDNPTC